MPNETSPTPEPDATTPVEGQPQPSESPEQRDESLQISEAPPPQEAWETKIKELGEQIAKLHHEKLRALADLQNFRRRALAQIAEARQEAFAEFATELLPILDNFERALQAAQNNATRDALVEGLSLTHRQLTEVLRAFHIEPIPSLGEPFNPLWHEAVVAEEGEGTPGIILEEIQKGYKMGNKVLRPAKVKVRKATPAPVNQDPREDERT